MITHPEKVLFPDSGITKGELCAYYDPQSLRAAARAVRDLLDELGLSS